MKIQQYAEEDLQGLTGLMNQWSDAVRYEEVEISQCIERMGQNSENKIFIAKNEEGKAVGYVLTSVCYYLGADPFVEIIQLLVGREARSRGIGALLVEHVCSFYRRQGITDIKLHSRIERERAHSFYRRLGFTEFKQSKFFEKGI